MTVKELIIELLACDMNSEVVLEDHVEFTDEHGKVSGSCYQIEKVVGHVYDTTLCFDTLQHFMKRGKKNDKE